MDKELYDFLRTRLELREKTYILTTLTGVKAGAKTILDERGQRIHGEESPTSEWPLAKVPILLTLEGEDYFLEALEKNSEVLLLGSGHVSRAIATLLEFIGCKVTVADDRGEYLQEGFFSPTVKLVQVDFAHLEKALPLGIYNGIIVVTRAHEFDYISLSQLRPHLSSYIGIMGSRKRVFHVIEALIKDHWTKEERACIHGPIGLDIGSETPEEIALSIVSEYLAVWRGKKEVNFLSHKRGDLQ